MPQPLVPVLFATLGRSGSTALMGLLGWLTDHFTVTYAQPDPYPFTNRPTRVGTEKRRLPT